MTVVNEIKKESCKKFADESPCICFNVRKASKVITSVYENMFKDLGITAPQATIINSALTLGPLTVNELAEAVATDRTTLTRNLKIMEREGLIRITAGADKRVKEINCAPKGIELADKMRGLFAEFKDKVDKHIGEERMQALCKELCEVVTKIQNI
ncbi:MAG: DNA-binding MarR family transcriptional regulator [Candidatus Omnitrophota bacterium]|jgi:DNA-binding MarR family transcriptional regulator